jgi:hypothetical protein
MINVKKLSSFSDLASFEKESVPFFQTAQYLQIFAKNFCKTEDLILLGVYDDSRQNLIGYGAFEKVDDKILFLGMKKVLNGQELTDYGDIFLSKNLLQTTNYQLLTNQVWQAILNWFKENGFKNIQLDNIRDDSETFQFFSNIRVDPLSISVNREEQEVAPFINLPNTWDAYTSQLEYHNRRELRRKMNRLERDLSGKYKFVTVDNITEKHFAEFIQLVQLSEDEKQQFMTKEMEKFFWDLVYVGADHGQPNGALNFLEIEGKPVAAILTFENGAESLAYNSGYDLAYKFYSAGLLIHAFKIRDLISKKPASFKGSGGTRYDFLRGHERYKYDLGGENKQLYKISINLS